MTADTATPRFESADIPTLRRALLADADRTDGQAADLYRASGVEQLAAWSALTQAASLRRMAAALLGLLGTDGVPAGLAERGRSMVGQVLDGWPEVLEGANDDVPDGRQRQIPGQQEIPAGADSERLPHEDYMQAVFDALDRLGLHPRGVTATTPDGHQFDGVISFESGEFPGRWPDGVYLGWDQRGGWSLCDEGANRNLWDLDLDTYANPAAVADRARTRLLDLPDTAPDEAWDGALDLRDAVAAWEEGDGEAERGYETDADPEPKPGDHGTCAAPAGRGAEGAGTCGYEIVLREERTTLMADGTDGHGRPGGQRVSVWRHSDVAIDGHHRAQLGGPA